MSIWLATLLAAAAVALAQLLVPRRLRGRPSAETSHTTGTPHTNTLQALALLVEAIAWAILLAVAIALAVSMLDSVEPINSVIFVPAIGLIAAVMTVAVVRVTASARTKLRLDRKIAKLTKAAAQGSLPPLPPSTDMQALMEPIAAVNRDVAALERSADGTTAPAELADLYKMRDGLIELYVEKDLARRICELRIEAPADLQKHRSVGRIESLGALLLRDRLIALFPAPATAALALGVYAVAALAAAVLTGQPDTKMLTQRIALRVGDIVSVAEARQAERRLDTSMATVALGPIRTASVTINRLTGTSATALSAASVTTAAHDLAAEQEIASLNLKLEATEVMLERAETALREAKAEQLRLVEEAERIRDVDVATIASDAQLERMAHEAAMAVEEERLRQKEIDLARRLDELEEARMALAMEKQRLVAMIEDKRRQAAAWESRVRLERMAAADEARATEREAIAAEQRESMRFEQEKRRIEERKRKPGDVNVAIVTSTLSSAANTLRYVPASAPSASGSTDLAETSEPARSPGSWYIASVGPPDAAVPQDSAAPEEAASELNAVTLPAAQGATKEAPRIAMPRLSPLAERECDRVRTIAGKREANAGEVVPASSQNRKAKLSLDVAQALLECGQALMSSGEIASARLAFAKVATAGFAKGALALGTTYDPHALSKAEIDGSSANLKLARFWYKRALLLAGQ